VAQLAQLAQQAVGVQVAPVPVNTEGAVDVQLVLPRVESVPAVAQPEPKQIPIPAVIDAPQAAEPDQRSNPPAVQQPASAVGQSNQSPQPADGVVQTAPTTRTQLPPNPSPITNWWVVLASLLLVLMIAAGSILGLLFHQLRQRR
jgi:hypothetical protein